jgi:hypothetical protein
MSTSILHSALGIWFSMVAVLAATGMASGVPPTLETVLLVLVAGITPAAVVGLSARRELQPMTAIRRR